MLERYRDLALQTVIEDPNFGSHNIHISFSRRCSGLLSSPTTEAQFLHDQEFRHYDFNLLERGYVESHRIQTSRNCKTLKLTNN